MNSTTAANTRIVGLDVARAIALLGMFVAHLAMPTNQLKEVFTGFPAALFAVLAGVSLGILSRETDPTARLRHRYELAMRGVVLVVLGIALTQVSSTIEVVLLAIGWCYLLLNPLGTWCTRNIALAAAALAAASMVLHAASGYLQLPQVLLPVYPLVTWMTYFAVGLLAYRLVLDNRRAQWVALGAGLPIAITGTLMRGHIDYLDTVYSRSVAQAVGLGLLDSSPHTGGLIDLATTAAGSLAVLAACLLLVRRSTYVVPLQAMGAMSLTVYVAHILTAGRVLTTGNGAHPVAFALTVTGALVLTTLWQEWRGRGPLESAMRWLLQTLSGRRLAAGAVAMGTTAAIVAASPAAQAMHSTTFAEPGTVSDSVVSLSIGSHGSPEGNCTGTAIAPHWVVSARHCVDGQNDQAGTIRIGQGDSQRTVPIDRWELAPRGDIALMHTPEDIGLATYPKLADQVDQQQAATIYGWSSDGSGGTSRLPMGTADFEDAPGFSLYDGPDSLLARLRDGARIQPGDSGGPLFLGDEIAGVLSASINPDNPEEVESPVAMVTPLQDSATWIADTIAQEPEPSTPAEKPTWQSPVVLGAGGAVVILCLFGATALRRRRQHDAT